MRVSPSIPIAFVVAIASPLAGQDRAVHAGFGASSFDLSGTGSTWIGTAGYTSRVAGPFYVELGTAFFNYENQFGGENTYLFPELSAVLKVPRGSFRPYLAAGAGFTVALKGDDNLRPTLHLGGGFEIVGSKLGVRSDFRLRSIDPFAGNTADFTLGPVLRF